MSQSQEALEKLRDLKERVKFAKEKKDAQKLVEVSLELQVFASEIVRKLVAFEGAITEVFTTVGLHVPQETIVGLINTRTGKDITT